MAIETSAISYANATTTGISWSSRLRPDEKEGKSKGVLRTAEAGGCSFTTGDQPRIRQWIYKKDSRQSNFGGRRRIPQAEVDRSLFRTQGARGKSKRQERETTQSRDPAASVVISSWGRIESVQISGLMAEVGVSMGDGKLRRSSQHACEKMQLKLGQTAAALKKATDVMILRV
jgi:molybdopterin-binding protein